ncbi:MAG: hypothetical protein ACFB22_08235 [Rhodothalassiaceae bacterium]
MLTYFAIFSTIAGFYGLVLWLMTNEGVKSVRDQQGLFSQSRLKAGPDQGAAKRLGPGQSASAQAERSGFARPARR